MPSLDEHSIKDKIVSETKDSKGSDQTDRDGAEMSTLEAVFIGEPMVDLIIVDKPSPTELADEQHKKSMRSESFQLLDEMEQLLVGLEQITRESGAGELLNALNTYHQELVQARTTLSSEVEKTLTKSEKAIWERNLVFLRSMLILFKEQFKSLDLPSFKATLPEMMQQALEERLQILHQQWQEEKSNIERASYEEIRRLETQLNQKYQRILTVQLIKERQERRSCLEGLALRLKLLETYATNLAQHYTKSLELHRILSSIKAVESALENHSALVSSSLKYHPIHDELQVLRDVVSADPIFNVILQNVPQEVYYQGVLNGAQLCEKFHRIRDKVQRVQFVSENGGLWSHIISSVLSYFTFRPHLADINLQYDLTEEEARDVEVILARTEKFLSVHDFNGAVREMIYLQGWPRRIARDWIHQARDYLELRQALDFIDARVSLMALPIA